MGKLITYLNEYENTIPENWYEDEVYNKAEYVISKKYGFIQRLVDNDKIDWEKFKEKNGTQGDRCLTKWFQICGEGTIDGEHYSDLESVLMLLSIQDNPVEFLIDILK